MPPVAVERCPGCAGTPRLKRARTYGESSLYVCQECATEFVAPQPSDERLGEIYSRGYYDPWAVGQDETLESMKKSTFSWILDQCDLPAGARVLDIGCATGFLLSLVQDRGCQAWGIDLNAYAIEQCRAVVPSARVHCGELADGPFTGTQFDAIVMVDFLEHVRDPLEVLTGVARRLADGGVAVISTPRTRSLTHRLTRRGWPQYKEEHLSYFSLLGLTRLLTRCGFEVVRARPTRKTVTLNYAHRVMQAYPEPFTTPAFHLLWRALPFLREVRFPAQLGEMTVVARKATAG